MIKSKKRVDYLVMLILTDTDWALIIYNSQLIVHTKLEIISVMVK
jgi:hypothetical protein